MRKFVRAFVAAAAIPALLACNDSTGLNTSDIAGTWDASTATFASVANPTTTADGLADGAAYTIVIDANGAFTATLSMTGFPDDVLTGTVSVSGNAITLTTTSLTLSGTVSRSGDTMTVDITSGLTYNFGGTYEAATEHMVFARYVSPV